MIFSLKNIEKIKLYILLILIFIFILIMLVVIIKNNESVTAYSSTLQKNIANMESISLRYIIDNNTYFNLFSDSADSNLRDKSINLQNLTVYYKQIDTNVTVNADNGVYELERIIKAYGNLHGSINEILFNAGQSGIFEYDYKSGKGSVKNGVTASHGSNDISAARVIFDTNNNFILFEDNVTVDYSADKGINIDK